MRGGLVDDAGQCAKLLGAGGYSRVVQGICHLGFSFGWNFMGETIGEARSSCQQVLSCGPRTASPATPRPLPPNPCKDRRGCADEVIASITLGLSLTHRRPRIRSGASYARRAAASARSPTSEPP